MKDESRVYRNVSEIPSLVRAVMSMENSTGVKNSCTRDLISLIREGGIYWEGEAGNLLIAEISIAI